tara:strand:- start:372 stop:599 length:228 start_codon:yes stop_codon:yes gene_type:complete
MRNRSDSERLYIGFRNFVKKEKLDEYDNEYLSKTRPGYKFMIPFIYKYVDVESLKNKSLDLDKINLVTYFSNIYC